MIIKYEIIMDEMEAKVAIHEYLRKKLGKPLQTSTYFVHEKGEFSVKVIAEEKDIDATERD